MAEKAALPPEITDEETPIESAAPEGLDAETLERRSAALAQVVKFGDPVLRSAASPVTDFDEDLAADGERMVELMRDAIGVGLAATQLGILRRLLVFQAGADAEPTLLVNPEIEWASGEEASAEEGCLSLPGIVVDVERPLHEARVLQHEIDHLDGVLMIDRTSKEHRRGALRALREGDTYAPEREVEEEEPGENGAE
jgi:peptide deformylase